MTLILLLIFIFQFSGNVEAASAKVQIPNLVFDSVVTALLGLLRSPVMIGLGVALAIRYLIGTKKVFKQTVSPTGKPYRKGYGRSKDTVIRRTVNGRRVKPSFFSEREEYLRRYDEYKKSYQK
jgi:hypothetical protein